MHLGNKDGRKTLAYAIRDEIRQRIIRGVYEPGLALREQNLEIQLGNSRGPIREGLRLLLPTGLVDYLPWRGFRVRQYTRREIENLYRVRAVLEGMIVESLADVEVEPIVADLDRRLQSLEQAFARKDLDAYFEQNVAFHRAIATHCSIEPLERVVEYATEVTLPIRYHLMQQAFPNRATFEAHSRIIDRISAGDFAGAKELTEIHILEDLETVRSFFDSRKPPLQKDRPKQKRPRKVPQVQ